MDLEGIVCEEEREIGVVVVDLDNGTLVALHGNHAIAEDVGGEPLAVVRAIRRFIAEHGLPLAGGVVLVGRPAKATPDVVDDVSRLLNGIPVRLGARAGDTSPWVTSSFPFWN